MKKNKNIAFVPTSEYFNRGMLFEESSGPDNRNLHNVLFKKRMANEGNYVNTIDGFESNIDGFESINIVIFEKIDYEFIYLFNIKFTNSLLILIPWEPEVVSKKHSINSLIKVSKWFDYVLTWNDSLVDNIKFFKLQWPYLINFDFLENNFESFNKKKLLVQISSNLHSRNNLELYSLRSNFNDLMSKLIPKQFDFYGKGWGNNHSYKGIIENKIDTLSNYKFSLCFENMKNGQGYITEKIFDCFRSGVVPVYYGADNITDYIPGNCYIDYRYFQDPYLLLDFIKNMDYLTWKDYLVNAKLYLESEKSKEFSIDTYIRVISEVILKDKVKLKKGFFDRRVLYLRAYQAKIIKKLRKIHFFRMIRNFLRVK